MRNRIKSLFMKTARSSAKVSWYNNTSRTRQRFLGRWSDASAELPLPPSSACACAALQAPVSLGGASRHAALPTRERFHVQCRVSCRPTFFKPSAILHHLVLSKVLTPTQTCLAITPWQEAVFAQNQRKRSTVC